jgi:hypothetical protein
MTQKHVLLFVALAMLIAFPAAGRAQISLTSFDFTPPSINVASAPVDVTVSFTASSSVTYFEMAFADPNGVFLQRGSKSLSPPGSVSDSVVVTFPPFSPEGTWKVIAVFLADTAGNTLFLDTTGLIAGGFNTNLTVTAVGDALNPDITDFSFAPNIIDTSLTSQNVVVSFTATDDLAGVSSVYAGFVSPSGQTTNDARLVVTGRLQVIEHVDLAVGDGRTGKPSADRFSPERPQSVFRKLLDDPGLQPLVVAIRSHPLRPVSRRDEGRCQKDREEGKRACH